MMRLCYPYVNVCGEVVEKLSEYFVRVKWDDGSVTVAPRYFLVKEEDIKKTHEVNYRKDEDR